MHGYELFYFGAALLLLLASLPALDKIGFTPFGSPRETPRRFNWLTFWKEELGAITTTYYTRGGVVAINGSTTAITAAQASQVQKQSAVIVFGVTGDAQATFTHNWGLDKSAPVYQEPEILVTLISTALTTYMPLLTFDRTSTNTVLVNKTGGDACTVVVTLRLPHSVGQ